MAAMKPRFQSVMVIIVLLTAFFFLQYSRKYSSISDSKLRELSGKLGKEWETLAIHLGFRIDEIDRLKEDHRWEEERIFNLLIKWRQRQPPSENIDRLLSSALKTTGRIDLASNLGIPNFDVETCRAELITFYKTHMGFIQLLPWGDDTEDMEAMFVNLELSHARTQRTGEQCGRVLRSNDELFSLETREGKRVNRVLISGGPGSGKTTLFAKLAYDWAQQESDSLISRFTLVFLLSFREIQEDMNSLTGAIFDQLLPLYPNISKDGLENYIRTNQACCLILADGFDERPSGFISNRPKGAIENILKYNDYRDCFLVISTRPRAIYNLGDSSKIYTQVTLSGFSEENCSIYIHNFFGDNKYSAAALQSGISKSKNLQKLSKIPVMLLLLCLIWSENQHLPDIQTKLYQEAIYYMWKRDHFKKYGFEMDSDDQLQQGLDVFLVKLGRCVFRGVSGIDQLLFSQSDFGQDVYEKACTVGLLTKEKKRSKLKGSSPVTFVHKSFQEFCSACFLVHLFETKNDAFLQLLDEIDGRDKVSQLFEILGFACGLSVAVAKSILKHLANVFKCLSPDVAYITHGKYGIWPLFLFARESGIAYESIHNIFKPLFTSSIRLSPESLSEQEWIAFEIFLQSSSESKQQSVLNNIHTIYCSQFLSKDCIRLLFTILLKMVPMLQTLTLRNHGKKCNWSSEENDINRLTEAISMLPLLSDLTVHCTGGSRYFDLTTFLSKLKSKLITRLDIHDSSDHAMFFKDKEFADYLSSQTSLSCLSITNLDIGQHGSRLLLQAFESNLNLKTLCISGSIVQDAIEDMHSVIPQLENLQLCNCGIDDVQMKHFAKYAVNAGNLKKLDLSNNTLEKCQSFGIQLMHCHALEELTLRYARITSDGIELLSKSIAYMSQLAKLDVRHNQFGLSGLQALLMSLNSMANLEVLNLGPCSVPESEACSHSLSSCLAVAGITLPTIRTFHKIIYLEICDKEIIRKMCSRSWDFEIENAEEEYDSSQKTSEKSNLVEEAKGQCGRQTKSVETEATGYRAEGNDNGSLKEFSIADDSEHNAHSLCCFKFR